MSKAPETDTPKKRRGATVLAWVLMAMIIGGLGGFGVTNFGGGITTIGTVGTKEISTNEYARSLQQELTAFGAQFGQQINLQQAQALGLDRKVLQSVITRAALDNEAARIGVSAGDEVVASEITSMASFQGTTGSFDRETYRFTLQQNNMTEADFEAGLRGDIARSLLQGAVVGGFQAPAALTDTLFAWSGERRGFSMLRLTEADLPTPLPEPTEADLTAYHDANIAQFTRPEAKRLTYAALLPDALAKDMPVDEAALKELYQTRIAEFVIPEKRLVERLVFGSDADAAAAKARLDAGETFESLVAERKLSLEDIDLGDVSKEELGAAGEAVFALEGPAVVGPFQSDLGPALFRMNAILSAQETTFDEARASLAAEMQTDAARRAIADKVEAVDDLLAGGATLEDVAKEQGLTVATTDYAEAADDNAEIAAYPAFRKAAAAIGEGDFPEAILLDDGGLVILNLEEIVPPMPHPLDDVRDKVVAAWRADALAKALAAHAIAAKSAVEGGASLGAYGIVEVTSAIDRQGFVEGAPETLLPAVFGMAAGELQVIEAPGFTALVQLDSIAPAVTEGEDAAALRESLQTQAAQAIAQDAFTLYTSALTSEAGITLDQAAINAVHAQFQ
jgi:peptidyl-prolyl cis-trans isomerase D